jgi:hypothetical protein
MGQLVLLGLGTMMGVVVLGGIGLLVVWFLR